MSVRRQRCAGVGAMLRDRWDVISVCDVCALAMRVDLALVAKVSGARVSLWNRKARCRRLGCKGWVEFRARAPGMYTHEPLIADDRDILV